MASQSMARKPVTATVTILSDNPPDFSLTSSDIPVKGTGDDAMISFNNDGNAGYEITFDLQDNTGKGYVFFQRPQNPSPDDALSVKLCSKTGHCPGPGQSWDEFKPTSVQGTQLVVENANSYPQYFGFAFYFSLPNENSSSLKYDPIGDNRNGFSLR